MKLIFVFLRGIFEDSLKHDPGNEHTGCQNSKQIMLQIAMLKCKLLSLFSLQFYSFGSPVFQALCWVHSKFQSIISDRADFCTFTTKYCRKSSLYIGSDTHGFLYRERSIISYLIKEQMRTIHMFLCTKKKLF